MAITKDIGRQTPLVAIVRFTFADVVDAVAVEAVDVPPNAIVVGGALVIETAFNSATSDVADIGDGADPNRYTASAINIAATGRTALTLTGFKYTAHDTVDVTWNGTGTAPTAGAGYLELHYVIEGRANENM